MRGGAVPGEFLCAFAAAMGVSGRWLLVGKGPARERDAARLTVRRAPPGLLLGTLAGVIGDLNERLDRVQAFADAMYQRLEAGESLDAAAHAPEATTEAVT
jgi:hypothetical protein